MDNLCVLPTLHKSTCHLSSIQVASKIVCLWYYTYSSVISVMKTLHDRDFNFRIKICERQVCWRLCKILQEDKKWSVCRIWRQSDCTWVVTHMLPETSTQKMTRDSSMPEGPLAVVATAGSSMKVTSSICGISSSMVSTRFRSPQNSHVHTYNKTWQTLAFKVFHLVGQITTVLHGSLKWIILLLPL